MTSVDMEVSIGALRLKNPVMPASGTFGAEMAALVDFNKLGALVTKSITPYPRAGNPNPRVAETYSGMINAVGIQSIGIDAYIEKTIPQYRDYDSPLVVSISADTADEFQDVAYRLNVPGVSGIEVNISCPNLEDDGKSFAMDPKQTFRVIKKIRSATSLPIIAKLTPNTGYLKEVAMAAESAGVDAVLLVNTFLALSIDVETRKPKVGNVTGGLSGPAIKPIAVRMVYQVANSVNVPVIGCGGICSAEDALEYMIAGATAVQVGTYNFVNPNGMLEIIQGMQQYALRHKLNSIRDVIGSMVTDVKY